MISIRKNLLRFFKENDYQGDCRLLLQGKNCKERLILSPLTSSGVETTSEL